MRCANHHIIDGRCVSCNQNREQIMHFEASMLSFDPDQASREEHCMSSYTKCPNCTDVFKGEIYTCVNCGHVLKEPPTKEEALEVIRGAVKEGRIRFETGGTTIDCICTDCGEEKPITFFRLQYNIAEDSGPCGCGGTWKRKE